MCICPAQFNSGSLGVHGFDILDFSLVTDSLKDSGLLLLVYSKDLNHLLKVSVKDSRVPGIALWCHDLGGRVSRLVREALCPGPKKIKIAAIDSDGTKETWLVWSEYLCPPHPPIHMLKPKLPKVMVLVTRALGSCLSHKGGSFISGISALLKGSTELLGPFGPVKTQGKVCMRPRREPSADHAGP